jgi:hypothetical protein
VLSLAVESATGLGGQCKSGRTAIENATWHGGQSLLRDPERALERALHALILRLALDVPSKEFHHRRNGRKRVLAVFRVQVSPLGENLDQVRLTRNRPALSCRSRTRSSPATRKRSSRAVRMPSPMRHRRRTTGSRKRCICSGRRGCQVGRRSACGEWRWQRKTRCFDGEARMISGLVREVLVL